MEAHEAVLQNIGVPLSSLTSDTKELISAWNTAPMIAGLRIIFDLPALIICVLITSLGICWREGIKKFQQYYGDIKTLHYCFGDCCWRILYSPGKLDAGKQCRR